MSSAMDEDAGLFSLTGLRGVGGHRWLGQEEGSGVGEMTGRVYV